MLARTADSLYWTARYIERADFLARVLDAAMRLSALPSSYAGDAAEWESAIQTAGVAEAFHAKHENGHRRDGDALSGLRLRQRLLHRLLLRGRPAQQPRRAYGADQRHLGRHQRRLERDAALRSGGNGARGLRPLPRLGDAHLAGLRRFGPPHHAAQRRVLVPAPGHGHRAGGQHSAPARREVSPVVAGTGACGRQPGLLPVDHHPARGLGAHGLSLGLSQGGEADPGGGPSDPEPADAPLARLLLRRNQRPARPLGGGLRSLRAGAEGGGGDALPARPARIEGIFHSGLHEFITTFLRDNSRLSQTIHDQYLA